MAFLSSHFVVFSFQTHLNIVMLAVPAEPTQFMSAMDSKTAAGGSGADIFEIPASLTGEKASVRESGVKAAEYALPDEGNLDVFGANEGVADFNMAFEEDVPIRDRACSWDLAMDHDTESAAVPMTPAAGVQHPGQSASSMSFMQQVKGSAYSVFSSQGDPEPSLFQYDDELLGVDPIPGDPTTDKDSEDSYDISNGIMTRYNTYRQHSFNLRNSGNVLDLSFGLNSLEPKRKRKAKARQKSPKITHAVAPEMSLPKKRGRKPGKGTGAKHESRKFDAQMRPRIKGRFVSRKVYRDLYGSDGEGGDGGADAEGKEDDNSMEISTSSTSLSTQGTDNSASSVSTDAEDTSASSVSTSVADGEGGKYFEDSNASEKAESEEDSSSESPMKVESKNTGITETANAGGLI